MFYSTIIDKRPGRRQKPHMKFRIPRFTFKGHFISCHKANYVTIRFGPPTENNRECLYYPCLAWIHDRQIWVRKRGYPVAHTLDKRQELKEIVNMVKLWLKNGLGMSLEEFLNQSISADVQSQG